MLQRMGVGVSQMVNNVFNFIVACSVLLVMGLLGYQTGDRSLPIDIRERKLITPEVKPGEELQIKIRYITQKICNTHTDNWIFDGENVRIDIEPREYESGSSQVGVEEEYAVAVKVPFTAKPGHAFYRTITTYRCNLVQSWFWPLVAPPRDVKFEIVPLGVSDLQPLGRGTYTALAPADDPANVTLQLEPAPVE